MSRYFFVVLTNPVEGREDEYNDWYDNTHLDDVLALEGFVSAQRFRFVPKEPTQTVPHRYLAIYEIETDDLEATHQKLVDTARTEAMPFSDALEQTDLTGWYYEPITDKIIAPAHV
jgi:hypothetical protein